MCFSDPSKLRLRKFHGLPAVRWPVILPILVDAAKFYAALAAGGYEAEELLKVLPRHNLIYVPCRSRHRRVIRRLWRMPEAAIRVR